MIATFFHPDNGWFSGFGEEGEPTWNHWTGAISHLKAVLGRKLTKVEMTVVSLSLGFGTTPSISEEKRDYIMAILWPEGNPRGTFLPPDKVIATLSM